MAIFNEYLTGEDRILAIEDAKLENEYIKLSTLFEMTNLQLDQMQRDAEMKVFEESGTYDDLAFLYQEADKEVSTQRQNIFQKIIAWFSNMFATINKKIKSIFNVKSNDIVDVPGETVEKVGAIEKAYNQMKNGLAKLRNKDYSGALDILKVVVIPAGIVGGGVAAGVKIKKMKKGECDALTSRLNKIKVEIENGWNTIKTDLLHIKDTKKQTDAKESIGPLQKIINVINSVISSISSAVMKAVNGVKDGVEKGIDTVKGLVSGNKNDQKINEEKQSIKNDKFAGQHNNVTIKRFGQFEYRIDRTTGKVTKVDKKGNETDVPENEVPQQFIKLVKRAKASTAMKNQQNVSTKGKRTFNVPSIIGGKITVNPATHTMTYIDKNGKSVEVTKDNIETVISDKNPKNAPKLQKFRSIVLKYANESADIDYDELENLFTEANIDFEIEDVTFESLMTELETNGYVVESDGDIISIRDLSTIEESVASNIFGTDIDDDSYAESSKDAFDQELEELIKEFGTI